MRMTGSPAKGNQLKTHLKRKWRCFVPSMCSDTVLNSPHWTLPGWLRGTKCPGQDGVRVGGEGAELRVIWEPQPTETNLERLYPPMGPGSPGLWHGNITPAKTQRLGHSFSLLLTCLRSSWPSSRPFRPRTPAPWRTSGPEMREGRWCSAIPGTPPLCNDMLVPKVTQRHGG